MDVICFDLTYVFDRLATKKIQHSREKMHQLSIQVPRGRGQEIEEIRNSLTRSNQKRLLDRKFNVTPLIDLSILNPVNSNSGN